MNVLNARKTNVIIHAEDGGSDLGTDPASPHGFVSPLAAAVSASAIGRDLVPIPLMRGDFNSDGQLQGDYQAQLSLSLNLEAIFFGRAAFALTGVAPTPVARAGGYVHEFPLDPDTEAGGTQITGQILQGPEYYRSAGMRGDKFAIQSANKGPSVYTLDLLGIGKLLETSLGDTPVKDAFKAMSYLDGFIKKNGVLLGNIKGSSHTIMRNSSRADAEFTGGIGAGILADAYGCSGQLDMNYEDNEHYLAAKNFDDLYLEWLWANGRLDLADAFIEIIYPKTKMSLAWPTFGGKGAIAHSQKFTGDFNDSVGIPASLFTSKGPFNIPASSHLGIKVNGGATVDNTITAGAARTAAQIAADIGTVSGLKAAFTFPTNAAVPNGPRMKLETVSGGASASIQIDTTVTGDCSAVLGLSNVAATGRDPVLGLIRIFNSKSTPYNGTT